LHNEGEVSFWAGTARVSGRIVTAVVVLVGTATVVGLLDRFSWVFELADVFRLQYLVALSIAAVAAAMLRRLHLAGVATALAALDVVVIGIPFAARATAAPPHATKGSLRLLVTNVEVGNTRFDAIRDLIEQTKPDMVGVIELTPG
jgi:endonuclease/exonuclease/phosphatase (EEP) superfamily protein YafD